MAKKIKVCKRCSGFDVKELKDYIGAKEYSVGCIGKCARKCPELSGKVYGLINGELTVCNTKEEFFEAIKKIVY